MRLLDSNTKYCSCSYTFNRADLLNDELKMTGTCKECRGSVYVSSSSNRTELHMEFAKGDGTHSFSTYRRVTSTKSKLLFDKLKTNTVHNVYHEQSKDIADDAEYLPRDFVSEKSLSNIKSKHNLAKGTAIHELRRMKYSGEFGDSIQEIQTDPFCVIFWSKQQKHYYSQLLKKVDSPSISLDATGTVVTNNSLLSDIRSELDRDITLQHVFLYLISAKNQGEGSVPVAHMLSAQQDSIRISYFFKRFMQEFKTPSEAIMDDSKALLKSCSDSFARCHNINDYIRKCFDVLDGKTSKLPSCFLRLDIAHWVKSLHRNKIWKDVDRQVKHFYLCCIGVIIISDNYLHVCEIVERMLKLANGRIDSKASHTILSKLVESHKTHEVLQYTDDNEHADDEKNDQHDTENVSPSAITWFDKLAAKVLKKRAACDRAHGQIFQSNIEQVFQRYF